ncbi:predicted protein [Micromonas commoda]|uniref:Uncharacterized protein n=1 Tax=Micromonas commoda (strain RCC299 / NOUM17 / CCMP2709) TaxID=296587 RepID=C1E9L3_MICCC|nr:predicted protein [Micromonas commoda]ACO64698.1 predicted protein [Micromonas commoda]|eukprot:XP_002503440.1 predicted protein [Micromonas commoda]
MLCGQARALVPRSLPRGGGDIAETSRAGSSARALPVVAKRSAKKRQARKLEKRDDARTMEKLAEERAARLAAAEKYRPPPPPPPTDPNDAKDRIARRERDFQAALARVGEAKAAARESEDWDPSRGYKPFDDVQDAVYDLALAKTAVYESHLELALSLLTVAKGDEPSSLDRFDWVYERGVSDGNVRCLSFMLAAMTKANVVSGVCEVLWVANECGVTGAVDPKAMKGALGMLADLEEMGLLDGTDVDAYNQTKEVLAEEESAQAVS